MPHADHKESSGSKDETTRNCARRQGPVSILHLQVSMARCIQVPVTKSPKILLFTSSIALSHTLAATPPFPLSLPPTPAATQHTIHLVRGWPAQQPLQQTIQHTYIPYPTLLYPSATNQLPPPTFLEKPAQNRKDIHTHLNRSVHLFFGTRIST